MTEEIIDELQGLESLYTTLQQEAAIVQAERNALIQVIKIALGKED